MLTRFWRLTLVGAVCVVMTSCARKQEQFNAEFPGDGSAGGDSQVSNIDNARPDISDDDLGPDIESQGPLRGAMAKIPELGPVYFDYDSANLRGDAQEALDGHAAFLRANRKLRVQIEGHCDERGTLEYNLALGERRAQTVRKYLVGKGISSDQLYTISYGEEKPAAMGHEESAWRWNRRAEFQIAR